MKPWEKDLFGRDVSSMHVFFKKVKGMNKRQKDRIGVVQSCISKIGIFGDDYRRLLNDYIPNAVVAHIPRIESLLGYCESMPSPLSY